MRIKLITDSTSDMPARYLKQYDIAVAPLSVHFGEETFKDDGSEMTSEEFFEKLRSSKNLPTTSQVSPGEFVRLYDEYLDDYDHIISIHLSSKLSGTYNAAHQAKEILSTDKIHVIDSKLVSFALGFAVIQGAKMIERAETVETVVDFLENAHDHMESIFIFDTLEYLLKGGRLSKTEAILGGLINIKPILTIKDGELKAIDKVRGRKKAIKYALGRIEERAGEIDPLEIAIYESDSSKMLEEIKEVIESKAAFEAMYESKIGIVVGTHAGPGCAAISYFKK